MKKLLKNILIFGVIMGVITWVANWRLSENLEYAQEYQYAELFNPTYNAEVVILGTSRANQGIDPGQFPTWLKEKTYNFALPGLHAIKSRELYHRFLKPHYPKPKLMIIEVDWACWSLLPNQRRLEDDCEYWPMDVYWETLLHPAGLSRKQLVVNRYPLLKNRFEIWRVFTPKTVYAPFHNESFYRGYLPYTLAPDAPRDPGGPQTVHGSYQDLIALKEWVKELQEEGIGVIFVQTPEFVDGRSSVQYEERTQAMANLATTWEVPLLNYLELPQTQPLLHQKEKYGDWVHLNREGSKEFSFQLGQDLDSLVQKEFPGLYP